MGERGLAKLFYVTNVFIFEETGKETREKWQCGAELIGAGSTTADVELISLALEVLKKTGIKNVQLRLSHAGLIRALLAKFGLSTEEQARLFDQILDGDEKGLAKVKKESPELSRILSPLLDMKGKSSGFLKNLKALFNHDVPELEPSLDNFLEVVVLLEEVGIKYRIDVASGRGFEYYTGVIYQLLAGGEHIGGGGRYDALIPLMGGGDIPASGFALYLDRLMNMVKLDSVVETVGGKILIKAETGEGVMQEAFKLVVYLHDAGYTAEVDLGGKEPADLKWLLGVRSEEPRFVLTNLTGHQRNEVQTKAEVLALLTA
jgi:histidyl-tRNA synthetase